MNKLSGCDHKSNLEINITKSDIENVVLNDHYYIFVVDDYNSNSIEYYLAPNKEFRTEADTYFIKSIIAHKNKMNSCKNSKFKYGTKYHFDALELWFRDELDEIQDHPENLSKHLEIILKHYSGTQNYINFFGSMTLKGWELFNINEVLDFAKNNHFTCY